MERYRIIRGEGEMITPALLSEAIDTIVDLFNERNAMKYYYVIFAHQKKENESKERK